MHEETNMDGFEVEMHHFDFDRCYVDTVAQNEVWMPLVVIPDRNGGEVFLAIDGDGTHLRVAMTPDRMRELARALGRTAEAADRARAEQF